MCFQFLKQTEVLNKSLWIDKKSRRPSRVSNSKLKDWKRQRFSLFCTSISFSFLSHCFINFFLPPISPRFPQYLALQTAITGLSSAIPSWARGPPSWKAALLRQTGTQLEGSWWRACLTSPFSRSFNAYSLSMWEGLFLSCMWDWQLLTLWTTVKGASRIV